MGDEPLNHNFNQNAADGREMKIRAGKIERDVVVAAHEIKSVDPGPVDSPHRGVYGNQEGHLSGSARKMITNAPLFPGDQWGSMAAGNRKASSCNLS